MITETQVMSASLYFFTLSSFQVMPGMKFVPFYTPSIVFGFFDFLFEFVLQVLLIFQLLFSNWSAPHFLK